MAINKPCKKCTKTCRTTRKKPIFNFNLKIGCNEFPEINDPNFNNSVKSICNSLKKICFGSIAKHAELKVVEFFTDSIVGVFKKAQRTDFFKNKAGFNLLVKIFDIDIKADIVCNDKDVVNGGSPSAKVYGWFKIHLETSSPRNPKQLDSSTFSTCPTYECKNPTIIDDCVVKELGEIYNEEPVYTSSNTPCRFGLPENYTGELPLCYNKWGYSDTLMDDLNNYEARGNVGPWVRAGARMTVLVNAYVKNGELHYERRLTYYSRQRKDLPEPCRNPILCPPKNGLITKCVSRRDIVLDGQNYRDPYIIRIKPGPYYGVNDPCCSQFYPDGNTSQEHKPCSECAGNPGCGGDKSFAPKVRHGYSFSPCKLNNKKFIAGYALAPDGWWFYNEPEYQDIINRIKQEDPYQEKLHTIYLHFQMQTKYITCCSSWTHLPCPPPPSKRKAPDCGRFGTQNTRMGPTGKPHRTWGFTDQAKRERSVKIIASIGYAKNSYGLDPEECCSQSRIVI